jgi:hypothetical protein
MAAISKRDAIKNLIKTLEKKLGFKMKGGILSSKEANNKSPDKEKKGAGKNKDHKEDKNSKSQNSTHYKGGGGG